MSNDPVIVPGDVWSYIGQAVDVSDRKRMRLCAKKAAERALRLTEPLPRIPSPISISLPRPTATPPPVNTFLGLPGELRNRIYHYVFSDDSTTLWKPSGVWAVAPKKELELLRAASPAWPRMQVLLACRQVYHEAHALALRTVAFHFPVASVAQIVPPRMGRWLQPLREESVKCIGTLEIWGWPRWGVWPLAGDDGENNSDEGGVGNTLGVGGPLVPLLGVGGRLWGRKQACLRRWWNNINVLRRMSLETLTIYIRYPTDLGDYDAVKEFVRRAYLVVKVCVKTLKRLRLVMYHKVDSLYVSIRGIRWFIMHRIAELHPVPLKEVDLEAFRLDEHARTMKVPFQVEQLGTSEDGTQTTWRNIIIEVAPCPLAKGRTGGSLEWDNNVHRLEPRTAKSTSTPPS